MGLAILLSAKSFLKIVVREVITSSPLAWTSSAGQLTSLSSMIVLQPPLLCKEWGGHPLCVCLGTVQY